MSIPLAGSAAPEPTSASAPTGVPPVVSFERKPSDWRAICGVLLPIAAAAVAWLLHVVLRDKGTPAVVPWFSRCAATVLAASVFAAGLQWLWPRTRPWIRHHAPLFAAGILSVCVWDLLTLKFALLPRLYFPGPDRVLQSMVNDGGLLLECVGHSLVLLLSGYVAGLASGLACGVLIGWSPRARYWGMPLLKIIGPIPATAWLPIALVLFPSAFLSAMSIVAIAVWFPVTMLTASGVANVRVSYLDVARTLGAGRGYLIFRVVLPAAMPSIFLGLFMGLGASFLSLVVAEMLGVKSGLGWYMAWAKESMDYSKVYAALLLMAAFFSLIMTGLFMLRDRVLVWQKGVIKW